MIGQEILIALGSNLPSPVGPPAATVADAVARFGQAGLRLRRLSRFFATPAFPPGSGPEFVNACAVVTSGMTPDSILAALHDLEAEFERERCIRWGPRSLDLDLLAIADRVIPDRESVNIWRNLTENSRQQRAPDRMILPHPRLEERAFVLVPLADVAPRWRHPLSGKTVERMLADLPKIQRCEPRALP